MQAEVLPLYQLYNQGNTAYVIPSYQRPFSWPEQKAIDLLNAVLEDVTQRGQLTVLGTILICPVPTSPSHPFGSSTPSSNAPQTIYEVVDGQQRMTVFALIGHALKNRLSQLKNEGLEYNPTHDFENMYRTARGLRSKEVPCLIRASDSFDTGYKSELATLIESFIHAQTEAPSSKGNRLYDMKCSIEDWVVRYLDHSNFQDFSEYLLTKCNYIHVVADDQNTAFAMFEPLNSTSEPLTSFEVYRSNVTRDLNPTPNFEKVESLLDYSHAQRDDVTNKSNTLIHSVAQAFDGQRPKKTFNRLKVYLDDKVENNFVDIIESAAEFYDKLWYCAPGNTTSDSTRQETTELLRFLKASSHDAPIPLLIRYYIEKPEWIPAVVKIITAFFALWRVAFETGSLPAVYRGLLNSNSTDCINIKSGAIKTPAELAGYFRNALQNKLGKLQPGEIYKEVWLRYQTNLSYNKQKTICRVFVLHEISLTNRKNLVPNDPWTKLDDMEHIASLNSALGSDVLNMIGNLTILPPSINRSLQNAQWSDKREIFFLLSKVRATPGAEYADGRPMPPQIKEYIESNTESALSYLEPLTTNKNWGTREIEKRSTEILSKVWDSLWTQWLNPS